MISQTSRFLELIVISLGGARKRDYTVYFKWFYIVRLSPGVQFSLKTKQSDKLSQWERNRIQILTNCTFITNDYVSVNNTSAYLYGGSGLQRQPGYAEQPESNNLILPSLLATLCLKSVHPCEEQCTGCPQDLFRAFSVLCWWTDNTNVPLKDCSDAR